MICILAIDFPGLPRMGMANRVGSIVWQQRHFGLSLLLCANSSDAKQQTIQQISKNSYTTPLFVWLKGFSRVSVAIDSDINLHATAKVAVNQPNAAFFIREACIIGSPGFFGFGLCSD